VERERNKTRKNMAFTDFYCENEGPSLQEMIDSDLKTYIGITGSTLHFQGISGPDMITDLELDSYPSFLNSYLEDFNSSAFFIVNPNNVMPLHHPLEQQQQVTNLSVNTSSNLDSQQQNSLQSPISLQETIDSVMKVDDVITESNLNFGQNFEGMDSFDMLNDLDIVSILDNISTDGLWSNTPLPTTSGVSTTSKGQLI
jgi:hypothetical protein